MSKLTLAGVRPITPMRRPASCGILVIFGPDFLPLPFAGGGTHSTATFLRSVATACAFFGTSRSPRMMARSALLDFKRLGAGGGAIGLHRAQTDITVRLDEGLGQRLDDLEVIAVGRTDRDPQGHRPHRKVVGARECADHGENPRERDEHRFLPAGARRWQRRGAGRFKTTRHRSGKQSFEVQFHIANMVQIDIVANFAAGAGLHLRHGYRGRVRPAPDALLWQGSRRPRPVLGWN